MNGEQVFESAWPSRERAFSTHAIGAATISSGLGTARAGDRWRWAPVRVAPLPRSGGVTSGAPTELRRTVTSASAVRIPENVLRTMREAAWGAGRTESEIWADAAREWLLRRMRDDEPQPPTPAAAALPVPRMAHAWHAIDALLAELRVSSSRETSITAPAA